MKTLLIGIFIVLGCYAQAQDSTKTKDTALTFTKIYEVPGMDKATIYDRVVGWSINAFEKARGAMQVSDRGAGILAFDARHSVPAFYPPEREGKLGYLKIYEYSSKIKIYVKDGKFKCDIVDIENTKSTWGTNFTVTSSDDVYMVPPFTSAKKVNAEWKYFKYKLIESIEKLLKELGDYVTTKNKDDF